MLNLENSKMTYGCTRSRFSKKYLTSLLNLNIPGGPVLELFSRGETIIIIDQDVADLNIILFNVKPKGPFDKTCNDSIVNTRES